MFDFKSNFCMLRNYVAFTVSGNRNNCRAWCTRQLPSRFLCQRRESRTTSTLDRWVPRLFCLAKKKPHKKKPASRELHSNLPLSVMERHASSTLSLYLSQLNSFPKAFPPESPWICTILTPVSASASALGACRHLGQPLTPLTCWGGSAFSQIYQPLCSFTS